MDSTVQATFTDSRPTFQREGPNIKITKRKSTTNKTNIVCCPSDFREEKQERHRSLQNRRQSNQYKNLHLDGISVTLMKTSLKQLLGHHRKLEDGAQHQSNEAKITKNLTDNVCQPKGFIQEKKRVLKSHHTKDNNQTPIRNRHFSGNLVILMTILRNGFYLLT